eukprot:gene7837-7267_t
MPVVRGADARDAHVAKFQAHGTRAIAWGGDKGVIGDPFGEQWCGPNTSEKTRIQILVCCPETLQNRGDELLETKMEHIGMVVVDELHLLTKGAGPGAWAERIQQFRKILDFTAKAMPTVPVHFSTATWDKGHFEKFLDDAMVPQEYRKIQVVQGDQTQHAVFIYHDPTADGHLAKSSAKIPPDVCLARLQQWVAHAKVVSAESNNRRPCNPGKKVMDTNKMLVLAMSAAEALAYCK